jgi:hypothetical protein
MASYLKTNTAVTITVGPFLDKTDGVTAEVALTVANSKITAVAETDNNSAPTLVLDNVAGNDATNTLAHITNDDAGYYSLLLTAANTNRVGRFKIAIMDAANHCPVFHEFIILPAQVYDSLILGTDLLDANTSQLGGTTQTGRDVGASVLLSSGTGTGQVSLSAGAVLLQATQTGVTIPTVTTVGSVTGAVGSVTGAVGSVTGNVGGNVVGSVASVTGAVGSVTSGVTLANGAHGGAAATMQLGGAGGLTATHTGNTTGSVGSVTGAVGSVTGAVGSVTGNVGGNVAGSVATVAANGITSTSLAADAINAASVKADAVTKIQAGLATPTNITAGTITTVTTVTNVTNDYAKYMGGAVWIDTVNGAAGSASFVNGIMSNPVTTLADAKTIADNLKLKQFWIQAGSALTLAADYPGYMFNGKGYTLALGGHNISSAQIERVEGLSGIGTCATGEAVFHYCHLNTLSIGEADFNYCHLNGTVILTQASVPYLFNSCTGIISAKITFAAAGQTGVISRWGGQLTIAGMVAGNTLFLDGNGDVIFDNTNTGGTVYISGNIKLTNNGSGQTIVDTSRFDEDQNVTNVTGTTTNLTNLPTVTANWLTGTGVDATAVTKIQNGLASSASITALNDFDPATDVVAHVTLVDTTTINTDMVSAAPTAAANADAVWDETLSGHTGAGSAGLALSTASSGGVDPSVLADAIWDEALSGHVTAGTSGKKLTDLINTDLSGVSTATNLAIVDGIVDAIKAKTDNLPIDPADESLLEAAIAAIPSAPTSAANADAVWDELLSGHTTTGSTGKKLTDISSTGGGGATVGEIDAQLSSTHGAGAWGSSTVGAGSISHSITVDDGSNPLDGVDVWVSTNESGTNVIARASTNAFGIVTFMLDAGTYYCWKQLAGYAFTNPQTFTVA